ncbi:MAG TPA: ATP-binding protein [Pirellulales bacterium]|nr:ATP-binding protein [Pirellulales bacterium]
MEGELRVLPFVAEVQENSLLALEILESLPHVICATSADMSRTLYLSPSVESVYGRPKSDFTGNAELWRDVVEPADQSRLVEAIRDLFQVGRYDLGYRIRRPNGDVRWLFDHTQVHFDGAHKPTRVISIRRDITEQRRADEAALSSGRLAAISTLAAGMAHEINNPVGAALLSAETAMAIQDRPEHHDLLTTSLRNTVESLNRCREIMRNILWFARNERSEKAFGDLNRCVRQARDLARPYADEHRISIEADLEENLPQLLLHPIGIQQVIVNLVNNAIEASPPESQVCIATHHINDSIRLAVRDHGRGMSDEERLRVFEPFFTTRKGAGGTGLGMSIAFGIVQDHGGSVHIHSNPGRGTTITLDFPLAASKR